MLNTLLEPADFAATVVAVPPIALTADHRIAEKPNEAVAHHIRDGGVGILLYGGNANLYHYDINLYADALEMMKSMVAASGAQVITSIGPDFGKALDQAPLVERSGLRNVMLLPVAFPADSDGVYTGIRRIVDRLGHPVILYIKRENYIHPDALGRLIDDGAVNFVKYAVERTEPAADAYLDSVLATAGLERVASGMGETPVIDHICRRRLATFTSGAVCIAPHAAMRLHRLLKDGSVAEATEAVSPFLAFERIRSKLGGIQVLHDAISQKIADMGPQLPFISKIDPEFMDAVAAALDGLWMAERDARSSSGELGPSGVVVH